MGIGQARCVRVSAGLRATTTLATLASLFAMGASPAEADPAPVVLGIAKPHKARKQTRDKPVLPSAALPATIAEERPHAAIPACSKESAAALDSRYNLHAWELPRPNFGDSILQDYGCWRTNLAKYGFGFMAYDSSILTTNTLNHYVPSSNLQQYNGQRTTSSSAQSFFLTYDLNQWGIPDGQLVIGGHQTSSTYIVNQSNSGSFSRLGYYQTAFDKKIEINVGIMELAKEFQGFQVGGNIIQPLGTGSGTAVLVGESNAPPIQPAALVTWHVTNKFYEKFGIARSIVTTAAGSVYGNSLLNDHYANPTEINFSETPYVLGQKFPALRPLYIDEVGYRQAAEPGRPLTWIRATGFYNSSDYRNYASTTGGQTKNDAVSLYVDRQVWQTEPTSADTAYKGIYLGMNAAYAKPEASAITQDYAARAYSYGLFGRPKDLISLLYEHQVVSPYVANAVNNAAACHTGSKCDRNAVNSYTILYTARIVPGVYATLATQYIDHPATTYSPNATVFGSTAVPSSVPTAGSQYNINHAVNFIAGLYLNL